MSAPAANADGADHVAPAPGTLEFRLACSRSFEQSQRLRNGSQYVAAINEVLKCANPKCGEALFDECTKIYDQLQTATPSVVFAAHDDAGAELTSVVVSIDGRQSRDQLDGKPVRVDPGSHEFVFSSQGHQRTQQAVLIRAGEQFRSINAVLPRLASAKAEADAPLPAASRAGVPLASYVLGGVSVIGLGAFVGFRLAASNRFDALTRECKPGCTASQVDSLRQKYTLSDVALGIGAAAAIAAVTVYLVAPEEHKPVTALQITPSEHGLHAGVLAQF